MKCLNCGAETIDDDDDHKHCAECGLSGPRTTLETLAADRDAARATVERVRALAVYLRDNGRNYSERDTARRVTADMIEAALTPPGDGGA